MVSLRFLVFILILNLYKVRCDRDLPKLTDNKLLVGKDRNLPNSVHIDCVKGNRIDVEFQRSRVLSLADSLTASNFKVNPFYSKSMSFRPITSRDPQRFTAAEVKHRTGLIVKKTVTAYAIQVDPSGVLAYWLPQGGTIDIPQRPNADQPQYVFTPDFSGCSWTVTPMRNGNLRLRHVQGDKEMKEFNNLNVEEKGGPVSYAMQYKDYGYIVNVAMRKLVESTTAFAYMHFSKGSWRLHVQQQTCAPNVGNCRYKDGLVNAMTMSYYNQDTYKIINSAVVFRIPV